MKRKMIIGVVAIILLISLLPLPQKIELTFYGINTANGEQADINVDMKYLRFLLLDDKMYGTITVKTETETFSYGEHLHYSGQWHKNNANDYAHDFSGWYFNETSYMHDYGNGVEGTRLVGFEPLSVHISSDFSKILILHSSDETKRYIGSTEKNQIDVAKVYFSGYYE